MTVCSLCKQSNDTTVVKKDFEQGFSVMLVSKEDEDAIKERILKASEK